MKAIANRGEQYLVNVSGEGMDATGQILDMERGKLFPEQSLQVILKWGYWEPFDGEVNLEEAQDFAQREARRLDDTYKKESGYVWHEAEGPGRGWWGPPHGTHVPGGQEGGKSPLEGLANTLVSELGMDKEKATQWADVMSLDKERFTKYAEHLGMKDVESKADDFFSADKEHEREKLRERFAKESKLSYPDQEWFASLNKELVGNDAVDAASILENEFGVKTQFVALTAPLDVHEGLSELIHIARGNPVVAGVLANTKIQYDKPITRTMTAEAKGQTIHVYQQKYVGGSTLIHELGHTLEPTGMKMYDLFGPGTKSASQAAQRNASEGFAELFMIMVGTNDQASLRNWNPGQYDFIKDTVPGMEEWLS